MTPEDAVVKFVELKILAAGNDYIRSAALDVLRAVASTAKKNEMLRCAAMLQAEMNDITDKDSDAFLWFEQCRKNLLITGGLKVEDASP